MSKLLLPISLLYHIVLFIRHKLYDWHLLKSTHFSEPVICVGNLSLGGTGKTPHTEYLIRLLSSSYRIATLSRGYGRQSKGFQLADKQCTATDIGDEPMQYLTKFNDIVVAVDEDRVEGVQKLLDSTIPPQVILLDDAFQHRKIEAGLNILLTEYQHLYCDDFLVPAGHLRDIRQAAQRADIIVVSKLPKSISADEKNAVSNRLKISNRQKIYFSYLEYDPLLPINETARQHQLSQQESVLLFTGIAHPDLLITYLKSKHKEVHKITFSDHHIYTTDDLKNIVTIYKEMDVTNKIVVTTEKDAARLAKSAYLCQLESVPLFAAPVRVRFHEEEKFNEAIINYVRENTRDCYVSTPSHT